MKRRDLNDLDRDIREHIEIETQDNIDRGMVPEEAHYAALRKFGNIARMKEDTRAVWNRAWVESLAQDVRYAIRSFLRAPAFALTVIGTIGLALGLNTALFTIYNAYVLRPLAVHDPYSLYRVHYKGKDGYGRSVTPLGFEALRKGNPSFVDVIAWSRVVTRTGGYAVIGAQVSDNYFEMLGVGTTLGRPLLPGDRDVVVLSDAGWRAKFGADPEIVSKRVNLLGSSYEIVGVAHPEFTGLSEFSMDFWIPLIATGPQAPKYVDVLGRLRMDTTMQQATASLEGWARQTTRELPEADRAVGVGMEHAPSAVPLSPKRVLGFLPLMASFLLVLLIACGNVANMMLARGMVRQREIGVRLSLGAGRFRLVRQLLTESLLLALPAALVGLAISRIALQSTQELLYATVPSSYMQMFHVLSLEADGRVFLFILAIATAATLLFGLAPALQATRPGTMFAVRGDFSTDVRPARLRNALVVCQVTVCVLLLICSGIFLRGGTKLERTDVRMDVHNVLDVRVREDVRAKVSERLAREPWVEIVAAAWRAPLYGSRKISIEPGNSTNLVRAGYNFVAPDYFDVFRIPLERGRNFTSDESRAEAAVAIVSEATAAHLWPGQEALGQSLRIQVDKNPDLMPAYRAARVVGIARDVVSGWIADGLDPTCFYFPTSAQAKTGTLVVRLRADSEAVRRQLDLAIADVSPGAAETVTPLEQALAMQILPFRASAWIASLLGAIALVLTLVGIYGVLSYLVSQRTKEIGIRMALGASSVGVVRLVLSQSVRLAVIGIALGVLLALGVSKVLASQIQIDMFDVLAYGGGIAAAFGAALAAAYFPSRRAVSVDPVSALRCD